MKLISDIINELMDSNQSLEGGLLKTKVLAARIGNIKLQDWVNGEISGFSDSSDLPEYRKSSGEIIGDYINGNYKYSGQTIPLLHLSTQAIKSIKQINVVDSISAIERFITESKSNLRFLVNAETQLIIEESIRMNGNPYFQILGMHRITSPSLLTNILSTVRSKLLDFMLALETEFGTQTEIETLKTKNSTITTIMNTTINNSGDGNVVNTGESSSIVVNTYINKGNKDFLAHTLKEKQVEESDINDLLKVVDLEPRNDIGTYSLPVSKWIKKMMAKALDGTWQVGIGAAGSIIADSLAIHYGWK